MHQPRNVLVTVALLSTVIATEIHAADTVSVLSAEKPKVAIFAEDVTVDGTRRPDLGRALADSLSTNLLRRGQMRVFNLTTEETKSGTQTLALPKDEKTQAPVMDKEVDYLLSFNLFSNANEHRLTVKKTRVSTSELVDSHQFFTYGRVSDVFSLMGKVVERIDPLPVRHAFPATQSPAEIRAAQPDLDPPHRGFWAGDYANPASPAYDPWRGNLVTQYDLKNVPKALIYRELGSIQHIDNTWKFTIVRPVKGVELRPNDPLHVLYDEGDVYANLRVGTVEREGAVADFGGTPEHHPLFNGDKVFGWHTPPVEKPAKAK
jgi:TolB-like protein